MKNTMDGIIKPDYEGQLFKVEATEQDSVYEGKPAVSYFDSKGKLTMRTRASDDDIRTWELLQAIDRLNAKLENLPELTLSTIAPQMLKWVIRSTIAGQPPRFFSKKHGWVKFDDLDLTRDFYTDDEKGLFALPLISSEWVVADEIDPESLVEKGPDDTKREWAMKLKHSDVDLYWNYATNKWVYYIQVKHSDQSIVTEYGKQFLEVPHCGEWVKVVYKTGEVTR